MVSISPLNKKRKIGLLILIIILFIILSAGIISFYIGSIRAKTIRLCDYPGSVWESQEPFIHLEVSNDSGDDIEGYLVLGDKRKEVIMSYVGGGLEVVLFDKEALARGGSGSEAIMLWMLCNCSKDLALLKVERDDCFNYQFREIVMEKKR